MKKLLILFLVISANLTFAQDAVVLRLNYEKGATYDVGMNISQQMGAVMSMGMFVNMEVKVTDVKDDIYDSEMKFTKMTMDMLQGGQAMSFDSSKSDDELDEVGKKMKAQMAPMLKAIIYAKGNNLGEITDVKVEPSIPGVEDMAKQSSNFVYPKEAIKVGSTWSMVKEEKGMKMNFVYTVNSMTKDKVILDLSGDVSGAATGSILGSMNIDKVSGIPDSSLVNMNMSVNGQELKLKIETLMVKK